MKVTIGGGILLLIFYNYSTVTDTLLEGENKPFLFFELKVSYCFKPNIYEFNEELINWDYKGFRLGFEYLDCILFIKNTDQKNKRKK